MSMSWRYNVVCNIFIICSLHHVSFFDQIASVLWWFYASKFMELLDTVSIIIDSSSFFVVSTKHVQWNLPLH